MTWQIRQGDARCMAELNDESVDCCITSPPYYGLRDYGVDGQLGLEATPAEYIENMVEVFREVRRVLMDIGTLWLNIGDSYAGSWGAQSRGGAPSDASTLQGNGHIGGGPKLKGLSATQIAAHPKGQTQTGTIREPGLKPKDLMMIPAQLALALRADGWYLRSDIIWHKPNPMPESVTDRPTSAHEHIFLFSKSPRYFYDAEAVQEAAEYPDGPGHVRPTKGAGKGDEFFRTREGMHEIGPRATRNLRNVWTVATQPYSAAHFATFPPKLIEPCVKAGTAWDGTILDPFSGAGTTGIVALRNDRNYIGYELNPEYVEMSRARIRDDAPLMNVPAEVAA